MEGHGGNLTTYMRIKRNYYWENMKKGFIYVLILQDLFTKFVRLLPLKGQTAVTVSDAFVKGFVSYFACQEVLLSDLGTNFKS